MAITKVSSELIKDNSITMDKMHTGVVVTTSEGLHNNANDTVLPTAGAVAAYVTSQVTGADNWDLSFAWGDHSTYGYATETYVDNSIANVINSAPAALDTLNELAAALGDDPNFATTITNLISGKQAAGTYNTIIGTDTDINTSGATIVDNIFVTDGVITSMGTRTLTLADLGYTGATNANYITNNNQLTNGAGYLLANSSYFKPLAELPSGVNLNSYRTTGYAAQNSNSQAAAGSNYPVSFAGILEIVNDDTGNGLFSTQRYARYASNDFYGRNYYNGSWTSWTRFLTTEDSSSFAASSHTHTWANISGETANSVNDWGGLRHQTNDGYIDFGPANVGWAHIYTDRPGFYFNQKLVVAGGSTINSGDIRSAIFYDSNNTGYYLNPADGTTSANLLGDIKVNGGKIHIKRGVGLTTTIIEDDSTASGRGQLLLDSHYSDLIVASRNSNANKHGSSITLATQSTSTNDYAKWVIGQGQYQEGADELAFAYGTNLTNPHSVLGTDNAYAAFRIFAASGGYTLSKGSSRAPIFYDSNNTGYFLDPASTSSLKNINMNNGTLSNLNNLTFNDPGPNEGIEWIGGNGWKIFESPNNLSTNSGGNLQFVTGSTRMMTISAAGDVYSPLSFSAPIFYDSATTSRYIDPGSTSNINGLVLQNDLRITSGHGRGVRFWDSDNYKIHMSGSTQTTWGGRVGGETTSDYNMYFTMTGGTNRGWVFKNVQSTSGAVAGIDASGNGRFEGDVIAFSASDRRLKDNIKPIENALEKVNKISGVEFDWNSNQDTYAEGMHDIGVIAQEIEEVIPEVVKTRDNGYKAVKYEKIVPLLIEAIKEQQAQIDELKQLINKQ